ncbi:MAG: hypothetical protein QOE71_3227 [Pseudonocardiales bacterium]|jgi:uncharacterized membrane protein YhaH (DUF805 family)|nr:hypothetical protein [Pseudonocardiales bacterium]
MSFADAIRSVFGQYATFSGRARRSEYWFWTLFIILTYIAAAIIDAVTKTPIIGLIIILALIIPSLAVTVRRLHDTGHSGWLVLISLIPFIGSIVLLVFMCSNSQPGPNSYGPSPKETGPRQPAPYGAY